MLDSHIHRIFFRGLKGKSEYDDKIAGEVKDLLEDRLHQDDLEAAAAAAAAAATAAAAAAEAAAEAAAAVQENARQQSGSDAHMILSTVPSHFLPLRAA
jgi:hypothetical protein